MSGNVSRVLSKAATRPLGLAGLHTGGATLHCRAVTSCAKCVWSRGVTAGSAAQLVKTLVMKLGRLGGHLSRNGVPGMGGLERLTAVQLLNLAAMCQSVGER